MTQRLHQQLQLIMQGGGITTITADQVPVLKSETQCSHHVVNFLRSGCPAVQVFSNHSSPISINETLTLLDALRLPGEEFNSLVLSEEPYVILVKRTPPVKHTAKGSTPKSVI